MRVGTQPHPWQLLVPLRSSGSPRHEHGGTAQPKLAPYKVTLCCSTPQPHPGVDSVGGALFIPSSSGKFGVRWSGERAGSVTTLSLSSGHVHPGEPALPAPAPPNPGVLGTQGLGQSSSGEGLPSLAWRPSEYGLHCSPLSPPAGPMPAASPLMSLLTKVTPLGAFAGTPFIAVNASSP